MSEPADVVAARRRLDRLRAESEPDQRSAIIAWATELADVLSTLDGTERVVAALRRVRDSDGAIGSVGAARDLDAYQEAVVDAGWHLNELGLTDAAIRILDSIPLDGPNARRALVELAYALNDNGRFADTVRLLVPHLSATGWNETLALHLADARQGLGDLSAMRDVMGNVRRQLPGFDLRHELLMRAERISAGGFRLDEHNLVGWHAAVNNSVLLSTFADDADAEDGAELDDSMRGRWAWLRISVEHVASILASAAAVLAPSLPFFVSSDGTVEGDVVGRALAARVGTRYAGVDAAASGATATTAGRRVLACWQWKPTRALGDELAGRPHRAMVATFAVWADWTTTLPVAPDVVGLLAQMAQSPWEAAMRVRFNDPGDPASGVAEVLDSAPDDRPVDVRAAELAAVDTAAVDTQRARSERVSLLLAPGTDPWWTATAVPFTQRHPVRSARFT